MATDFTLPELGENITAGDVLRVLVKAGDTIAKDQPVLELETDKATIEVPSSLAGLIKDVKVQAGDKVMVGQPILSVDEGGTSSQQAQGSVRGEKPVETPKGAPPGDLEPDPDLEPVDAETESADRQEPAAPRLHAATAAPERHKPERDKKDKKVVDITRGPRAAAEPAPSSEVPPAPAAPSVRRMARELGVDVNGVPGTGTGGRISVEDVKAHAKRLLSGVAKAGA